MSDDPNRLVILGYRLRGEAEPQTVRVPFSAAVDFMNAMDEAISGAKPAVFVGISFKDPDGCCAYTMIRVSDIVEMAWADALPLPGEAPRG